MNDPIRIDIKYKGQRYGVDISAGVIPNIDVIRNTLLSLCYPDLQAVKLMIDQAIIAGLAK